MAWPAPSPGRWLEAEGDLRPREMTVPARNRLNDLLGSFIRLTPPAVSIGTSREVSMRLLASLAATAVLIGACGGTAAVAPTTAPTSTPAPTPTPSPTPQLKYVFTADLKTSNEVPAITVAEASCAGKGTFTLNTTKDSSGKITAATGQFDLTISGSPT